MSKKKHHQRRAHKRQNKEIERATKAGLEIGKAFLMAFAVFAAVEKEK